MLIVLRPFCFVSGDKPQAAGAAAADGRAALRVESDSAGANLDLAAARAVAGAAGLRMADSMLARNADNNKALYMRAHALKLMGRVGEAAKARQVAAIRLFCR